VSPLEQVLSPLDAFVAGKTKFPPPPPGARKATYADLTEEQREKLRPFVKGRRLRDYGCGNLVFTEELVNLGARHIEAIDMDHVRVPCELRKYVTFKHQRISQSGFSRRGAVVAWPYNVYTGVEHMTHRAPQLIYVGSNTGGTVCGYPAFWLEMARREVLLYVPDEHNTLIVYGAHGSQKTRRRLMPEEYAGLLTDKHYIGYNRAHSKPSWAVPSKWRSAL
jgi:hypothetical protein